MLYACRSTLPLHIENLKRHRDWAIANLTEGQLHMKRYTNRSNSGAAEEICGTIACWLGWAKFSLQDQINPDEEVNYHTLAEQLFGIWNGSFEWEFLFSGAWAQLDNTIAGCIARTNYLIEHRYAPVEFSEFGLWKKYR